MVEGKSQLNAQFEGSKLDHMLVRVVKRKNVMTSLLTWDRLTTTQCKDVNMTQYGQHVNYAYNAYNFRLIVTETYTTITYK